MTDAILAWEMNGAPLSLAHGGPLRLIVPGYNGVNNIKYVKRVAFTPAESQAKIMTTGYRITPLGEQSKASEPSVQELNVKSFVTVAGWRPAASGPAVVYVTGVAFSGGSPIRRVEVSSDGGKTVDRGRRSSAPTSAASPGASSRCRCAWPRATTSSPAAPTDSAGNVQPEQRRRERALATATTAGRTRRCSCLWTGRRLRRPWLRSAAIARRGVASALASCAAVAGAGADRRRRLPDGARQGALHRRRRPAVRHLPHAEGRGSDRRGRPGARRPAARMPERVVAALKNGIGAMPSYRSSLRTSRCALARYVAEGERRAPLASDRRWRRSCAGCLAAEHRGR